MWESTGTRSGPGTFVTAQCPGGTRAIDGGTYGKTCTQVTVASEAPGREAYSYVWKLKHRALVGIPYGEEPITVYVVGDRAECLRQSAAHNVRADGTVNEGTGRLSADPAERCAGPVWIR